MQKIQYLVSVRACKDAAAIAAFMEEKGNEGFILSTMAGMAGDNYLFIFHRPKEECGCTPIFKCEKHQ